MAELGITQAQLAAGIGALPARVGHYLNGRNEPPLAHFMLIARYLHVTTDWLLFGGSCDPIRVPSSPDTLADQLRSLDAISRRDVEGFIRVRLGSRA